MTQNLIVMAWMTVALTACGGRRGDGAGDAGGNDGALTTDAGARADGGADAAIDATTGDAGSATHAHYDRCSADTDCPAGDVCNVPDGASAPAPSQCRPPCATTSDCVGPTAAVTLVGVCHPDHYCVGYCALGGSIPDCIAPFACHYFTSSSADGYCAR